MADKRSDPTAAALNEAHVLAVPLAPRRERRQFGSLWAWVVFVIGVLYFTVPLIATFAVSLRARPALAAYTNSFADPRFLSSLTYSFVIGLITVVLSIALIVPTAYWVRLRAPRLRPIVEFVTLLPFVIPPVVLVFGLIRAYSRPPLPFTNTDIGSSALLVFAYIVLSLPYMYRAVDTGLRAIDIRTLTEAAQSLGAGWFTILVRIILPNLRVALVCGAITTARHRHRRIHHRHVPGSAGVRPVPVAPRYEQGVRAGRRVAHQLRPDLARDDRDRAHRPRVTHTCPGRWGSLTNGGLRVMTFLVLAGIQKRFGEVSAVGLRPRRRTRRVRVVPRTVRLRQDDHPPNDRRLRAPDRRKHHARRP